MTMYVLSWIALAAAVILIVIHGLELLPAPKQMLGTPQAQLAYSNHMKEIALAGGPERYRRGRLWRMGVAVVLGGLALYRILN